VLARPSAVLAVRYVPIGYRLGSWGFCRGDSVRKASPGGVPIRTPDQRLRVFVSSSLGELAGERRTVKRAISALRLTPVLFELGARPHPPQELYRAYVAQSDVFIGLYWQSYGQLAPGVQVSGLEEEFDLSVGMPRLLYVKSPAPDREPRLADFLSGIKQQASYRTFHTAAELGRLVRDDLATLLSERFAVPPSEVSAMPARSRGPQALPVRVTTLVGRDGDIDEVAGLLVDPAVRLVTLTGPGGIGKTRLAVAVADRIKGAFDGGTAYVALATVTEPGSALTGVLRAVGIDLSGIASPLQALIEQLGDGRWLLVLDNLEQVVDVAADLNELLARCPGVAILATSRTVLSLRAEQEYPVPPLPLPADSADLPVEKVAASPSVALFVDRARMVNREFELTAANAAAVVDICRRLEGLPLAIELAAARIRLLDPDALLRRLVTSLDVLGTGTVELPARQHTLRATVEWSVGLLDDAERSLLESLAVFVAGCTIDAAAQIAALDEDRALDLTEALARHSLISVDRTELGPRCRMLDTIREFVAERLAARPDSADITSRHAEYYQALAEQADRPLRDTGSRQWLDRLDAEAGNLAATVRWYLANATPAVPHLMRVLSLFWFTRSHLNEARPWVEQLLPTADSLNPRAEAELLWTAAMIATDVGDDAVALTVRQRLESLQDTIDDAFLHALCQLALAGVSAIVGDIDTALRQALISRDQLQHQHEPFWRAVAVLEAGYFEMAIGRYDAAVGHLREVRDLARQLENTWLAAWSQVQLGTLAVLRNQLDDARTLLDEGLELTLATHSTRTVTLYLVAVARLASEEGDPERAALLMGAADGLGRRVGLRTWPTLRGGGAELAAQIGQALGPDRFDQLFAAGARLDQRDAIASARDRVRH